MPRPLRAVELFLALGATAAAVLPPQGLAASAPAPVLLAQHAPHASTGEGGEGGEGGQGEAAVASSDVEYLAVLGQMRGHLLVAGELMALGRMAQAEKHIGHPVEELYGAVEPVLAGRGVAPFRPQLTLLLELIQADPQGARTASAYTGAMAAIDAAMNGVPAAVRNDPRTIAAVVRALVTVAASEYDAAIADGAIVETIEYQDSRGFVLQAQRLISTALGAEASPQARLILAPLQSRLAALAKAWPSAVPPQRAVLPAATVSSLAAQL
jgi:hypothetical protein